MKKKVYIILGKSNSRKSSVLRCLTGCSRKRGNWEVLFLGDITKICYVSVSSPQEKDGDGISVAQFIEEINRRTEETVFISLQSQSTTNQPNGSVYLHEFINAGFDIQTIVCFDRNANTLNLPVQYYNSLNVPTNQTASEVRKMWGIV